MVEINWYVFWRSIGSLTVNEKWKQNEIHQFIEKQSQYLVGAE